MANEPLDPFAYAERFNPRNKRPNEPEAQIDPLTAEIRRQRENELKINVMQSPPADVVAKVTRVARETGEAPALVEDRLPDYEKAISARRLADVAARYSVLGRYFSENPRTALAAQGDHKSLSALGWAWDTLKKAPQSLDVVALKTVDFVNEAFYTASDLGSAAGYPIRAAAATVINSPLGRSLGIPGYDPDKQDAQVERFKQSMRTSMDKTVERARPEYVDQYQGGLLRGMDSAGIQLVGLLTGNPKAVASTIAIPVGSEAYQEARAAGKGVGDAARYGITQGVVEGVTEVAPASSLLTSLANKTGVGKTIANYLVAELPGELSATFLQSLSTWQVMNPDKTYNDWVMSLPDEAQQTVLGVLGGGTFTAATAKGVQTTARVAGNLVQKIEQAQTARRNSQVLTAFEKAAAESTMKANDPEGYAEMVGNMAERSGVTGVMVNAEAVREYMQSDSYDPYSDPLEAYRDQVDEAYEVGGDVVLPADFALGSLPGSSAWTALKDDMRLTAGGITAREAQTFEEAMADVVAEVEASQQQEFDDLQAQIDAQGKLLKSVQEKLMNAGFTPYAAQQNATLIVQRIATRAARMGQELQGNEFTTEVRQVLPPELAAARDADATDLVINALRKGKDPASQSGPSLLEWISARGGVNDTGGDLASMGLDQWHRGKPGKRKLLRKFDPTAALGGVSGAGDYGIDNTLRAAIEAGYFPELAGVESEAGASTLDTQVLLDAMSAELAGVKRYAADARVDGYRAAAQELDDLLRQRGLDPDGMSDAELRDAIAQLDQAGEGGFEQLPDTIDVDGVQRPTRNSEGQPIAGTEEGVRAFWAWFGDSKVVDAEGRPLVVYHGTRSGEIEAFDPEFLGKNTGAASARLGFFFAGNEATSLSYVDRTLTEDDRETSDGVVSGFDRVISDLAKWADENAPGFSKALRSTSVLLWHSSDDPGVAAQANSYDPSDVDGFGGYLDEVIREVDSAAFWEADLEGDLGDYAQSQIDRLQALKDAYDNIDLNGTADEDAGSVVLQTYLKIERPLEADQGGQAYRETSYYDLINQGKEAGSDGVIIRNTYDGGPKDDIFVAFSPTQIKSINNRGTFDPADPRILFQQAPAENSEAFKRWAGTDNIVRAGEAKGHDFKTGEAIVVEAFHGTARPDRIGGRFRKERATAGPMAYFTSSPGLASSYAEGKVDTSIDDDEFNYDRWFKVNLPGRDEPVPLSEAWNSLPATVRLEMRKLAPRVQMDDNGENVELGPESNTRGNGSYDWEIKQSRGNVLKALTESWLTSGALFDQEEQFLKVLKLAGMPTLDVVYDNPHAAYPSVFNVWISMRKPLVVTDIPQEVVDALQAAADAEPPREGSVYDAATNIWDKKGWTVREWMVEFNDPANRGYVWTRIPDGVTEVFQSFGYDGIIDYSGKGGGTEVAPVYIPFDEPQVKSVNNRGTFDRNDPRILFQSPREYYQSAYHGSPHIFDKFSLDKIGTGEGAQAYGWGLYFAGRKEIAEHYRETLTAQQRRNGGGSEQVFKVDGREINRSSPDEFMAVEMAVLAQENERLIVNDYGSVDKWARSYVGASGRGPAVLKAFKRYRGKQIDQSRASGRLYQVEIPNDDEYLLWDKPLSEQPEKVKAALESIGVKTDDVEPWTPIVERFTTDEGENIVATARGPKGDEASALRLVRQGDSYQEIEYGRPTGRIIPADRAEAVAQGAAEAKATQRTDWDRANMSRAADFYKSEMDRADNGKALSMRLHDAGIAGIKYLDGGSRSQGDGSYNYVVFDDNRVSITAYEQAYADGPRGRIRFEQVPVIELFQGRNLSTLLHELGHQYLEELRYDATGLTAPDQLIKDWETTQAWFKANGYEVVDGFIPTEAHELWARGFERYLMEGKAPSSALARVFETFRGWLMSIYKKVDALRSPITPEIREVFDRLLATDEELQQQREAHVLMPLFKDAAAIGMTGPEFEIYQEQFNEARVDAQSEVLAKAMREVKARVTKEYRDQRAIVEADVTESVDQRPLFRALRNLKTMPVRKGWLEDNMGLDVFDLMPKRVPPLWSDKGSHPDAVAEMSGYGSGRQMIEALIGAELAHRQAVEGGDKRTLRERTIQSEVDAIMRDRYGDPLTDGTIEREALAAVNNEKQGEVLASELRILSRKTGQRPTPYRIARQWARNKVRQGVYATEASPSAIQRHARAVAKHGSEAEKAMLAGKFDEAFAAKQRQMLSSALLAEAKAANDEVTAAQKRMDKIARRQTSKSVDQDYLDQAHALLEQVDLRPRSQKSIDRQGKWAEWAAAREAEGFDVVVPPSFEATLGKTNWTRLPVETMLALDETVAQIMHLGRLKQSLLDGKERREWDEIYTEAVAAAGGLKGNPPRDLMEQGWWDAVKAGAASVDSALLKAETIFDWLDGGDPNGVFNRIAFRPVAEAQGREQDMLVDYYGRVKALFEAVPANVAARWQDKMTLPFTNRETGLPERMKRHQLIAAALNVGNAGNLQRLTDGYGWNAAALLDYLNAELTAEEWQFVQGVWDTIDTLWPEIEAMERRVNGVAPEKVEATEIVTPFGTLRGGYYPAIYDTTRSYRQEENRAAGDNSLFEPNAIRATTRSGSTKARAEQVTAPILLDLGVINRHLGEVIHDITHREAVMQAWKFLTNERVMRAVDQALGPEIRKQFKPWVKFVANSWALERAGNEGFGKFLTKLRANATVVGMGLRATTMMTQVAGYSNSQEAIGGTWLAEAITRFYASPIESSKYVMENSDEVRHRMDTLDRDIRNELAAMTATNPATKAARAVLDGRKFFFHGIGYMDRMVVVPTWIAAYNKATAEGMAHDDARYAADKVVRASQGAGAPKDMAAIQRGTGRYGEALKLMTMFYTYLSAFYQRQRTLYRDATGEDVRRPRDFPKLAARAFWLIALPPILTEVLRAAAGADAGPDDDEWWAQWYLRKLLANSVGPIPLVRDVFEPAWNKARGGDWFQTSISPIQRGLESIVNTAGDIGNIARGEETKKATKNALETIGYTTGMIPGQVASAAQFLVDVGQGEADPETWSDWMEGLSTGKLEED